MSNGVWFINDAGEAIDPASMVVNGFAIGRIRRYVVNYAYHGNASATYLWARAGSPISVRDLQVASWERSTAPLPGSAPKPPETPNPIPPASGDIPVPSGTPPFPYAIVVYDSRKGQWRWARVNAEESNEAPPSGGGSGSSYPSVTLYPALTLFPSA